MQDTLAHHTMKFEKIEGRLDRIEKRIELVEN